MWLEMVAVWPGTHVPELAMMATKARACWSLLGSVAGHLCLYCS